MPNLFLDVNGLQRLVNTLQTLEDESFTSVLLGNVALRMIVEIKKRTAKGIEAQGLPMAPYSRPYALFRKSKGRPINKVNLNFHGSMLSAMTHTATKERAVIFFQNTTSKDARGKPAKVSNPAKAFFLNEDRYFFAFSVEEQQLAIEMVEEHIEALLQEARGRR